MRKKIIRKTLFLLIIVLLLPCCMKFALKLSPSLIPDMALTIFEECDPIIAGDSIPANLKMLEALLKSDPENKAILTSLSMGFCGYSMLFVEDSDLERASELYLRARSYGLSALGLRWEGINDNNIEEIRSIVSNNFGKSDLDALLWTAISWNSWIILNLDKPAALSQIGICQTLTERLIELNPDYQYGLPYILMGASLSFLPPMFGGDPERAKECFENALDLSSRRFFLAQYFYAKYYATRIQDMELFNSLLDEIIQGDPSGLKEACLINSVMRERAEDLKNRAEDLFF